MLDTDTAMKMDLFGEGRLDGVIAATIVPDESLKARQTGNGQFWFC